MMMKRVAVLAVAADGAHHHQQQQQKNTTIPKNNAVNHNNKHNANSNANQAIYKFIVTVASFGCMMFLVVLFIRGAKLLWDPTYNEHGPTTTTLLRHGSNESNKPNEQQKDQKQQQRIILSTSAAGCVATADVRGNLGPPSAVLMDANDNTDWLKHRWQAASDMHGTAIRGAHWLQLTWPMVAAPVELHSIVLDWEAAFAEQYKIQIRTLPNNNSDNNNNNDDEWTTVLEAPRDIQHTATSGQSPGVQQAPNHPTIPLHVVHTLRDFPTQTTTTTTTALRILMDHPGAHPAWGVSLWQVRVYGNTVLE